MRLLHFLLVVASGVSSLSPAPILSLEWGNYTARNASKSGDVLIYENVRFGRPPVGDLRFNKSLSPDKPYDDSHPVNCIGIDTNKLVGKPKNSLGLFGLPYSDSSHGNEEGEDCLFLDIYVPRKAFDDDAPSLTVIVWFHGGAYVIGSKMSSTYEGYLYSGVGPIQSAAVNNQSVIFVVGNYRTGAFGWLAGSYIEENAIANAGLWDQRLVLKFVHDHIGKVNGNPDNVSAWGESAGGGSILHHLVLHDPDSDYTGPLFAKALIQSPAFQWRWDRDGTINDTYTQFSVLAGCPDGEIACLRGLGVESLTNANQQFIATVYAQGLFPFGPAVDGTHIKGLPPVIFGDPNGKYHQMDSVIVSHVIHEADGFVENLDIKTEAQFNDFIESVFPQADVRAAIENGALYKYSYFGSQKARLIEVIRDGLFLSNVRGIYEAYKDICPVYMMEYAFPLPRYASHATDLLPTFFNGDINITKVLANMNISYGGLTKFGIETFIPAFSQDLQQYFTSHAISGDPSTYMNLETKAWIKPSLTGTDTGELMNVLGTYWHILYPYAKYDFVNSSDYLTTLTRYNFWLDAARNISRAPTKSFAMNAVFLPQAPII